MLKAENSRLLAKVKQLAVANKDIKMLEKLKKIKENSNITSEIRHYKLRSNNENSSR